jgi:transcriptional regulator with XRE-family HTH domain
MTFPDHSKLVNGALKRAKARQPLNRFEVLALLGAQVEQEGSLRACARLLKVSAPYLSDILTGKRNPGPKVLRPLGLKARSTTTLEYIPDV